MKSKLTPPDEAEVIARMINSEQRVTDYFITVITRAVADDINQKNNFRVRVVGIVAAVILTFVFPAVWVTVQKAIDAQAEKVVNTRINTLIDDMEGQLQASLATEVEKLNSANQRDRLYSSFSNEAISLSFRSITSEHDFDSIMQDLYEISNHSDLTSRREFPFLLEKIISALLANEVYEHLEKIEDTFPPIIQASPGIVTMLAGYHGEELLGNYVPPERWTESELKNFTRYVKLAHLSRKPENVLHLELLVEYKRIGERKDPAISEILIGIQDLSSQQQALVLYNIIEYAHPSYRQLEPTRTQKKIGISAERFIDDYQGQMSELLKKSAVTDELRNLATREEVIGNREFAKGIHDLLNSST